MAVECVRSFHQSQSGDFRKHAKNVWALQLKGILLARRRQLVLLRHLFFQHDIRDRGLPGIVAFAARSPLCTQILSDLVLQFLFKPHQGRCAPSFFSHNESNHGQITQICRARDQMMQHQTCVIAIHGDYQVAAASGTLFHRTI